MPLATPRIGLAAVVAAITAICVLLVPFTITAAAAGARRQGLRLAGSGES
ncbi:hypothetical protein [Nonomuraea sp. NPDC049695]